MPDLSSWRTFQRQAGAQELALAKAIKSSMYETRVALREQFSALGANSPILPGRIESELDVMRASLLASANDRIRPTQDAAQSFVSDQLAMLSRFRANIPSLDRLIPQAGEDQQQTGQILLNIIPRLVDNLRLSLLNELEQLRAAGEDEADIERQMMSPKEAAGRATAWRHGENTLQTEGQRSFWAVANGFVGNLLGAGQRSSGQEWDKQAIAAIDERTTNCCLRVHGQVVNFNAKFKLTGTPRFRDEMQWSPFHYFCRTSVTTYIPEFEGIGEATTDEMRSAARDELAAREDGSREVIHPAHATSRRR